MTSTPQTPGEGAPDNESESVEPAPDEVVEPVPDEARAGDDPARSGAGRGDPGDPPGPPDPDPDRTQPDLTGQGEQERHGGHVVIGGEYELGDVLGTGATFTVYEARPVADGEDGDWTLVVKVLHPHLTDDEFSRNALQREVDASVNVEHPGVVKVLATGEDDVAGAVVPWTVMRRFPGHLLAEVAAGGGLPWHTALEIVADLLDGLGAVHDAGLVHRDVAPRNVMVDEQADGTFGVGLLDLGLTAPGGGPGDGETVSGSIIGMSPEQAKGQPLDARSDIYAAGALLYYAITGHAPYERAAAQDVLRAHVEAPVPAPSARKPVVPGSVDRIVARAMAKNPVRRYPDTAEMAATIRALLDATGPRVVAPVVSGDPTVDLDQLGSDPTERLDQVGGGTLRVGQLVTDDVTGASRTTVVGAYVPGGDDDATEAMPPVPPPPGARSGTPAPASRAGATTPPAGVAALPPAGDGADLAGEKPARRGRTVALAVAGVLVLGAGGLAVASLINSEWRQAPSVGITRDVSREPKQTPSETATIDEPDEGYIPPPPEEEPEYPSPTPDAPEPSWTPSGSPSPTDVPSEEPTADPTTEPTTPPTTDPTPPPTTDPTPPPDDGDEGAGGDDGTGDGTGGGSGGDTGGGSGGGDAGGDIVP